MKNRKKGEKKIISGGFFPVLVFGLDFLVPTLDPGAFYPDPDSIFEKKPGRPLKNRIQSLTNFYQMKFLFSCRQKLQSILEEFLILMFRPDPTKPSESGLATLITRII